MVQLEAQQFNWKFSSSIGSSAVEYQRSIDKSVGNEVGIEDAIKID